MGEKIKNKDAEPEESKKSDLQEGLEETFPGSDPVSASQPGGGSTRDDKDNKED